MTHSSRLDAVADAYRAAQADARMSSAVVLRWRFRRMARRRDDLDNAGLAQLRAVTDEFTVRGLELPK